MTSNCSELLLQVLQQFIKHQKQVQQIHTILITKGHLLPKPQTIGSKWKPTLLHNTLIRAHLHFCQTHTALSLFISMLSRHIPPNDHTFPPLIKAAAAAAVPSPFSTGASLHGQVIKRGIIHDPFVQTSLVSFYSLLGHLVDAQKAFEEIRSPGVVEYNAMVDAYAKNEDLGSAVLVFKRMCRRDVVSWTSIISGFSRNGLYGEAVRFFREMIVHEDVRCGLVIPNEATYVSVLSGCANMDKGGNFYLGKQIHGHVIRKEIGLSVLIGTALIDFYGKVGCLDDAVNVFNQMVFKRVCTWNAMISSLASNGRERQALDMFGEMKEEGLCPNGVTFVAVLTACARAELVELGLKLFQSMLTVHNVRPMMEHYGCVVDLLGRAGLLREAIEFLERMPFEPDASVLGALFGACKIHGANNIETEVWRRLIELQPQHCGQYVALSHINAAFDRWDTAADVRKNMSQAGISKVPAYSLIGI